MSLRDQLLKSGLASKQQAKKAERESKKRQHEERAAHKEAPVQNTLSQELAARVEAQREADRERNRLLELERHQREAQARAVDIMMHHDLSDPRATIIYYYRYADFKISSILVNEFQQVLLAQGQLAIVAFDPDFRVYLIGMENYEKIRASKPDFILCYHAAESKT